MPFFFFFQKQTNKNLWKSSFPYMQLYAQGYVTRSAHFWSNRVLSESRAPGVEWDPWDHQSRALLLRREAGQASILLELNGFHSRDAASAQIPNVTPWQFLIEGIDFLFWGFYYLPHGLYLYCAFAIELYFIICSCQIIPQHKFSVS